MKEEFKRLEETIDKAVETITHLRQENRRLKEEIERLKATKKEVVEKLNLLLDKIDNLI